MINKYAILLIGLLSLVLSGCTSASISNVDVDNVTLSGVGIDESTETLQIIDYSHHEIYSGNHYFVVGFLDLALNEVLDITWKQPNTTTWTHFIWMIETESEYEWYIYEDVTPINNLSNNIIIHNSNRNSNKTSGTIMKYTLFASLADANAETNITGATGIKRGIIGSGKQLGGDVGRESEIILKQGSTYLLRGIAKGAGYITFDMEWYEHANK